MSGSQTHGFDLIYEISLAKFRDALAAAWLPSLAVRMTHVDIAVPVPPLPIPGSFTQTGSLSLAPVTAANASLTRTSGTTFAFVVTFPHALVSLDPVFLAGGLLGAGGNFLGVHGVDAGPVTLTLNLSITAAAPGIAITRAAPTTVSALNVSHLFDGASIPAGVSGGFVTQLASAVNTAAVAALASAAEGLLPIPIPVALPPAASGPCGIGPTALTPQLVPAGSGTADALAFLITAAGSSGRPDLPSVRSSLAPALDADLLLGTELALRIVCCVFPKSPQLVGFPQTPSSTTGTSCTFGPVNASFRMGAQKFDSMTALTIAIGMGTIDVSGTGFKISDTGWEATATFNFSLRLRRDGGSLLPVSAGAPSVSVDSHIEWWAWLLIAVGAIVGIVVGIFTGGVGAIVVGGIIGAVIGAAIVAPIAIIVSGFGALISGSLGSALGATAGALSSAPMIPTDVFSFFGTPSVAADPTIDDIHVPMSVHTPPVQGPVADAYDLVLAAGTWIDLDSGMTGTGTPPPGADLRCTATGTPGLMLQSLAALDPARMAIIGAAASHRFDPIAEASIAGLVYPGTATGLTASLTGTTFGVRTTAGRYAKCLAWIAGGNVHLRYLTYDTPLPLTLPRPRIAIKRGSVSAVKPGVRFTDAFDVARTITWTAQIGPPLTGAGTITYTWKWNGAPISGRGTLPDGTAYTVNHAQCVMTTEMGAPLKGALCVFASTGGGFTVEACSTVDLAGTESVSELGNVATATASEVPSHFVPPGPGPDPAEHVAEHVTPDLLDHEAAKAQLQSALEAGFRH